ncbi:MAG: hypothetical protein GY797_17645 [Deltaproteobacteria bacterium]|nr:hypothetical protein [Deltaproteobacteria bacterium]
MQVFIIVFSVGIFVLWKFHLSFPFLGISPPVNVPEYLQVSLLFFSLTAAYMITYTALEADSPSLVIVSTIIDAGPEGLEKKCFDELVDDDVLIKPRVHDLGRDKMMCLEQDRYRLTPKGLLMARIFIVHRQLMNIIRKGG